MWHGAILVQPSTKQPSTNYNAAVDAAVAVDADADAATLIFMCPKLKWNKTRNTKL